MAQEGFPVLRYRPAGCVSPSVPFPSLSTPQHLIYTAAGFGSRLLLPLDMIAQTIRAILLAKATVATFIGRFAST